MINRKWSRLRRDSRRSMVMLWLCSGFVVFGVHAGVLAWMISAPAMESGEGTALAVMIELSPEPAVTERGDGTVTAGGVAVSGTGPENGMPHEPGPESVSEPERFSPMPAEVAPEEASADPETPEPVETEMTGPEQAAVPLPVPQTKPESRPMVRRREVAEESGSVPVDKPAQMPAQASVAASGNVASTQSVDGRSEPSAELIRWRSRLMAHLERKKRYLSGARSRREEGTVYVRFQIDDSGNVISVSLEKTSGYAGLDDEALFLVHRASPVPAPPPGAGKSIVVPVRFTFR